ncbi:hemerythrin domain-containing protein [Cohnella caldifontis]|uniref:hemerythrin domain-containing protein n=1 Tax=Cohnella caldifontis TaxID=3027471 RepID=UPI0023ED3188|nr:hemerythrin domain-containing protein [Cohnella sp. YIM B05605]
MIVHNAAERKMLPGDVRQLLLDKAIGQTRIDLDGLKAELRLLYAQACKVRTDGDAVRLNRQLRRLDQTVKQFLRDWNDHTRREAEDLFPYAAWYLGEDPELFAYLEQEDELAGQFIRAFLHALDRSVIPVQPEEARRMASYLLQAYAFLKNRFEEEEEMLDVLTDRSNRIDY